MASSRGLAGRAWEPARTSLWKLTMHRLSPWLCSVMSGWQPETGRSGNIYPADIGGCYREPRASCETFASTTVLLSQVYSSRGSHGGWKTALRSRKHLGWTWVWR